MLRASLALFLFSLSLSGYAGGNKTAGFHLHPALIERLLPDVGNTTTPSPDEFLLARFMLLTLQRAAHTPQSAPDTGYLYEGGEVEKLINHCPLKRKANQQSGLPNSQRGAGNHATLPRGNNPQERSNEKGREEHQHQPGAANQTNDSTYTVDTPVTITFVGQFDAGKSSLANCMLNYNHFLVLNVLNREREKDALLMPSGAEKKPQVRVRSMPGYGSAGLRTYEWLRMYPVHSSEIVVFVLRNSINELDIRIVKGLIEKGLPPNRILFVRNKFDVVLEQKLGEQGLRLDSKTDAEKIDHIKTEFQNELSDELNDSLRQQITSPDGTPYREKAMLFTSSKDICSSHGIPELLAAIKQRMRQTQDPGAYKIWDEFCGRRLMGTAPLINQWIEAFIAIAHSGNRSAFHNLLIKLSAKHQLPP